MPDKETKSKRPAPISYRPPKGMAEAFHARVAASGLSVNAFITEAIFGRNRHRPDELQILARLRGKAAQISDQLHRIAFSGADENTLLIEAAQRDLAEIRTALLISMGRGP